MRDACTLVGVSVTCRRQRCAATRVHTLIMIIMIMTTRIEKVNGFVVCVRERAPTRTHFGQMKTSNDIVAGGVRACVRCVYQRHASRRALCQHFVSAERARVQAAAVTAVVLSFTHARARARFNGSESIISLRGDFVVNFSNLTCGGCLRTNND